MRIAPLACKTFSAQDPLNYDALFQDGILSLNERRRRQGDS